MTWRVTYRIREGGAARLVTADLDPDWARGAGVDPVQLGTAAGAAWSLALVLGANGHEDAELVSVTGMPMLPPGFGGPPD